MSKEDSDDSNYSEKMVSKLKVRYASYFAKKTPGARLCQLSKPLADMVSGDQIPCGSEIRFPKQVLKELRFICFKCNAKFDSLEGKILHVLDRHHRGKGSKLCPTCFAGTKTPTSHTIKITGNVSSVVGGKSDGDNVGDSVAEPS